MYYEFSETRMNLYLTLYKKNNDVAKYEIYQDKQKLEIQSEGQIVESFDLFSPCRLVAVSSDDFKISLQLHKNEEKKWYTINGPVLKKHKKNTEFPEDEPAETPKNLWAMLEDVYVSGDAETRNAMLKSFQDSNGEYLSTNWDTVKNQKK